LSIQKVKVDQLDYSGINLEDFRYVPDTFGTIQALGIDKYPGEMPIVRELLQNADDSGASYFKIFQNSTEIFVEHDGKPFSKPNEVKEKSDSDFYRISHIGLGKTEEETTGRFGIGFTSVFHITDSPRILSNGWDFSIRVHGTPNIIPIPFNKKTIIYLPLRLKDSELSKKISAEVFDEKKAISFENQLVVEAYHDIFFLKNVNKIEGFKNGNKLFTVSKKVRSKKILSHYALKDVSISITYNICLKRKTYTERWKYYSYYDIEIPDNFKSLDKKNKQKTEIAFPISLNWKRISKKYDDKNYSYYTLPVMISKFNFKYNALMLYTTSGRSNFVSKEGLKKEWNYWQANNIVNLLVYAIKDFIQRKIDPNIVYYFFPDRYEGDCVLDEQIYLQFKNELNFNKLPFFFSSIGQWVNKQDILMNWDGLAELCGEDEAYNFISIKLKEYNDLFINYDIKKVGLEFFIEYLDKKYGSNNKEEKTEDPLKIRHIFEYLGKKRISSEYLDRLRNMCIILTDEKILRSSKYPVFFPTDEKMPLIPPGDIVNKLIYNTRKSKSFLQNKIKIKRMNIHNLIMGSFLLRLDNYDDEQKFDFIMYLIYRQKDVFRKKKTINELKNNLFNILNIEKNIDDNVVFFNTKELTQIFSKQINYISDEYNKRCKNQGNLWIKFLKKIGVREIPEYKYIVNVVDEISRIGFNKNSETRINKLIEYLDNNWKKFYSKELKTLQKTQEYRWLPTKKKMLEYPNIIYTNEKFIPLIGKNHHFLSIKLPKNKKLIQQLGLINEPKIDDVIDHLLQHMDDKEDRPVSFKIYSFLNAKAQSFQTYQEYKLRVNRTIWFKKKLWSPKKVFIGDQKMELGPNGWLRAYLKKDKITKLQSLCLRLNIQNSPNIPISYIDWLIDFSNYMEDTFLSKWQISLIKNIYKILSSNLTTITEEQFELLMKSKIILTENNQLVFPRQCYLIRNDEELIYRRLEKSGLNFNIVKSENIEMDTFYIKLGVKEIISYISATRTDENEEIYDERITHKLRNIIPWLDGFEYRLTGEVSQHNLIFQTVVVYRVKNLTIKYELDGWELHSSNSIQDVCCLKNNDNLKIYLKDDFNFKINDHINLLTLYLTKYLNPNIDKFQWSLILPQILNSQKIFGISPYARESVTKIKDTKEMSWEPKPRTSTRIPQDQSRAVIPESSQTGTLKGLKWEPEYSPDEIVPSLLTIENLDDTSWDPEVQPSAVKVVINVFTPEQMIDELYTSNNLDSNLSDFDSSGGSSTNQLSQSDKILVARWGEYCSYLLIVRQLLAKYPNSTIVEFENGCSILHKNETIAEVIWENLENEMQLPYDIFFIENGTESYIEVKSTINDTKDWFQISRNQWLYAKEKKENYHVYRVYNVGTDKVKVLDIPNLYQLWLEEKIVAHPLRIQI